MKNRKILISALGIVVALVFGIVVAYAALSSTLNAKFNGVTQNAISWDVGFNEWKSGTDGYGTSGATCGHATISKNSITIDSTTLSKPGDYCDYGFEVRDSGDISAKISSIIASEPDGVTCEKSDSEDAYTMVCGNITYKFYDREHNNLYEKIQSSKWFFIKVTYTGTNLSTLPITHNNPGFTLVFAQA